jgi:hypothetical protein
MLRKLIVFTVLVLVLSTSALADQRYRAKIKTKSGGIIGNVTANGDNEAEAVVKIKKRYPDCQILSIQVIGK